jgi:hypothetical protein
MALVDNIPKRGGRLGCIQKYESGCPLASVESGNVLAPWVSIDFVDQNNQGGGAAVTVGNKSSSSTDPQHCAVIKSFEFGHSDGSAVRVTIHDTQGGSFSEFMKHLVKDWICLKDISPGVLLMKVEYGWAKAFCSGPVVTKKSASIFVLCDSVEANYSEGKFIFEITGKDIGHRMFEGGAEWQMGGEGYQGMHVLHAIKKFMCESMAPNVGSISFKSGHLSSDNGDELFEGDTADERKYGPKGKWDAKGMNKLEVVRRWLDGCPSINGLMWTPQYDSTVPTGEIVFWEDAKPNCTSQGDGYWNETCLGTYIVNGGPLSPVIEFNPKIKWGFASVTAVGGQMGDLKNNSMETEGAKNPGHECLPRDAVDGAGTVTKTDPSDTDKDRHGGRAVKEGAKNDAQSKKSISIQPGDISADLVIVGDPLFCPPKNAMYTKNIAIVLINPFHITANGGECGEWLANPPCNEILSNKAWIVTSVTHRIEAGVYTTTIGVKLSTPGINLPASENFGAWSGGWKPVGVCS